jgi:hypothetical protein
MSQQRACPDFPEICAKDSTVNLYTWFYVRKTIMSSTAKRVRSNRVRRQRSSALFVNVPIPFDWQFNRRFCGMQKKRENTWFRARRNISVMSLNSGMTTVDD